MADIKQGLRRQPTLLAAVIGILLVTAGCHAGLVNGPGGHIRNGYGISIGEGSPTGGTYQSDDLLVRYHFDVRQDVMTIGGQIRLKDSIRMNFLNVNHFNLAIALGDAQGNLLGIRSLVTRSSFSAEDPVVFLTRVALPPQARQMAFIYQGTAFEGSQRADGGRGMDGGGQDITFWEYPIVK